MGCTHTSVFVFLWRFRLNVPNQKFSNLLFGGTHQLDPGFWKNDIQRIRFRIRFPKKVFVCFPFRIRFPKKKWNWRFRIWKTNTRAPVPFFSKPWFDPICTSTALLCPLYFDLLDLLLVEKHRSKYSLGKKVEVKSVGRSTEKVELMRSRFWLQFFDGSKYGTQCQYRSSSP